MALIGREHIVPTILEDEMKSSYLDYAMSVIVSRALPDARDGLKPVHRRILFGMHELGVQSNKPHKKSARIVGDVLGKYHPHGDSSVYEAMVRMAQEWSLRYPLVDGQGNFGSVDGDSAAAMRYTESRLAKVAAEVLSDIDKDTVDFIPNFDDSLEEPTILPTTLPTLLVNGASGIAVGMATNIPPHNLTEIINGLHALIKNPDMTPLDMLEYVPAPDFPTGGIIYGYSGVHSAYHSGRGRIIVRSKAYIEEKKNNKCSIIVSELPYQVNKSRLIEKIAELVRHKSLEGISDIRDESDRDGIRVVIEIKRDAIPGVVLNNLFKHTQMQVTFGANMLALDHGRPKVMNLIEMMHHFIEHRNVVVVRRTQFELSAAEKRAHLLEGFIIALDNIDEVIKVIRSSPDAKTASAELQLRFMLSEIQAKAILEMKLSRLTGLEREKIQIEYAEIIKTIERLKSILASKDLQMNIISNELQDIKDKYGDERRTEIIKDAKEFTVEDMIANEDVIVTITHKGLIKRTPVSNYRRQHKGGRGASGTGTHDDDFVEHVFRAATHHNLLFFTDMGRCFRIKVYDLPEGSRNAKGRSLANVIQKSNDETVTAYLPVQEFSDDKYILMATKKGTVKKTALSNFANVRITGIKAITLNDSDKLEIARITDGTCDIIIGTREGLACRFRESDVRQMGRTAAGVRGIKLSGKDYVVSMVAIKRPDSQIIVIGQKGMGKRTRYEDFRLTKRGAKGVISMNITAKTGKVVRLLSALDTEDLVVITAKGVLIRQPVKSIRTIGRNTQGVRLIRLDEGDTIADITIVTRDEEEPTDLTNPENETQDTNVDSDITNLTGNAEGTPEATEQTSEENENSEGASIDTENPETDDE
ncbi:MAG: DNA gyrase subunit A [Candidatus Kapabacteria bacterium]|jgi:DNA gyrase subunit A|nr:DNA gyrase subunit A [Candidatus Kapabacteria bacterium]